jgi:adenylate cyclase
VRLARDAILADREDATALANAGYALWWLGQDADTAISAVDRAAALNPNSAVACGIGGNVHAWAGNSAIAIERCARAMRLSPRDPWTFLFFGGTGFAHLTERRLEEASIWLQRAHQEHPTGPLILAALVSTYAHLGRFDEAREGLLRLLPLGAHTTADWFRRFAPLRQRADRQFICEGLRLAGLPEQ